MRTLGLSRGASAEEVKAAYLRMAKKWHPDHHEHSGSATGKAEAEARFRQVKNAYQILSGGGAPEDEARGAAHAGRGGQQHRARYEPRGRAGYMGFGGRAGTNHWYEDTAAAAEAEQRARHWRMFAGASIFAAGLLAVVLTSRRDTAKRESGELVDAWFNQATKRWEVPPPHIYKDPMLSSLVRLKPPVAVHAATDPAVIRSGRARSTAAAAHRPATTVDGVPISQAFPHAYQARGR